MRLAWELQFPVTGGKRMGIRGKLILIASLSWISSVQNAMAVSPSAHGNGFPSIDAPRRAVAERGEHVTAISPTGSQLPSLQAFLKRFCPASGPSRLILAPAQASVSPFSDSDQDRRAEEQVAAQYLARHLLESPDSTQSGWLVFSCAQSIPAAKRGEAMNSIRRTLNVKSGNPSVKLGFYALGWAIGQAGQLHGWPEPEQFGLPAINLFKAGFNERLH